MMHFLPSKENLGTRLFSLSKVFFLTVVVAFGACDADDNGRRRAPKPDVSNIDVDVKVVRFDEALFGIDTLAAEQGLRALEQQFPQFTASYFENIVRLKTPEDTLGAYRAQARGFLSHYSVRHAADSARQVFKNFEPFRQELNQAFRYFKYYFPNKPVPEIYTFVSEYNYASVIPFDNALGIGLDMFLGANHAAYTDPQLNLPRYVSRTFTPQYLTTRTLKTWISDIVPPPSGGRLLDYMLYNGKQLYLLNLVLPDAPDSLKMAYTAAQTDWVLGNEFQIWSHFLKENLLYSTDQQKIRKLLTPSPNAPGMPQEAPGETANFIGWQIVEQFCEKNKDVTLEQMLKITNSQQFLDKALYKPKRK
jgi:hypothetical protein